MRGLPTNVSEPSYISFASCCGLGPYGIASPIYVSVHPPSAPPPLPGWKLSQRSSVPGGRGAGDKLGG